MNFRSVKDFLHDIRRRIFWVWHGIYIFARERSMTHVKNEYILDMTLPHKQEHLA